MLQQALKEWAVICRALAEGRQAVLLRKGGLIETGGDFEVEHRRFWLFPTYVHQQREGIKPEAQTVLHRVEAERPPDGVIPFAHWAEVAGVYHVHELMTLERINPLHILSEETVRSRFAYRQPGLHVLAVRVYRAPAVITLPDTAAYAGCRSWVKLEQGLPTEGAVPVLDNDDFQELLRLLDLLLQPTAFA